MSNDQLFELSALFVCFFINQLQVRAFHLTCSSLNSNFCIEYEKSIELHSFTSMRYELITYFIECAMMLFHSRCCRHYVRENIVLPVSG